MVWRLKIFFPNKSDLSNRDGNSIEYRQAQVPKSDYQNGMEKYSTDVYGHLSSAEAEELGENIRYWSDFSRVYYLPRSLQKLPDPPSWEETCVNWKEGQDIFNSYNKVSCKFIDYRIKITKSVARIQN